MVVLQNVRLRRAAHNPIRFKNDPSCNDNPDCDWMTGVYLLIFVSSWLMKLLA